ncbi:hypothetical protein OG689_41425 [Kitasatospora sp. NBC_00240]|uniref:hypothetical protein n=1 Tax=Kitasatospora sp. NBC_00240 TaxID=2903567 RepID=UPI002259E5A5|nr:hypothetical protein [Kitasatospora sp. NBC_00240]MCX5215618.1 hypothetical protein [Kitasatospora sp. NBC_00240]
MQTQWVHQFRDRPDTKDVEALVPVEELDRPRQVVAREREGAGGLVDGYVPQSLDGRSRTAVYTWVRAGDPDSVTQYLLDLLAEVCPHERAQ